MGRGGHRTTREEAPILQDDISHVLKALIEKHYLAYGIFWAANDDHATFRSCYMDSMMTEALRSQGKVSFVDTSLDVQFAAGQGTVGRVMRSQTYEWIPNIQTLNVASFERIAAARDCNIKTVITVAVTGGVVELGALMVLKEDPTLVQDIKASLKSGGRSTTAMPGLTSTAAVRAR